MEPAALRFSTDSGELDLDLVYTFLREETPWAKGLPRATFERSIENSLCFGAYIGEAQIGFARVVTDRATFAYLCDVFVLPAHRSRGYAKALMKYVVECDALQGLRRFMLVTSDAHHVYRPFGFDAPANPERIMERHNPVVYAKA
ncbi:GNAT family N-acetyltransferase [Paraburkholderia flava]|uniref:GNAT family N-acetyltransferase n=1 Tax=Paraburkholderia flava TaxID=2547393 RepID=UPI00105E3581|nr:GNAT family N-acetyltransferase [Paraburkholderia flava]